MNQLNDLFLYDPTSPTSLRWKVYVYSGRHYAILERAPRQVAGSYKEDGYASVKVKGESFLVHRIIWEMLNGQIGDDLYIDHKDGIRSNNNVENLRLVTKAGNARNHKKRKDNSSGIVGVSRCKGGWRANWKEGEKWVQRMFSSLKYGDEMAKKLATSARDSAIERLNTEGKGYTERHGK